MTFERRRNSRFSATAFLGRVVNLAPLPPYFGGPIEGRLVDLSSGGMAIFIQELIPSESEFRLTIIFPDATVMQTPVKVRYAYRKGAGFLHGIEFLALDAEMSARIGKMSSDYIDCESRIQAKEADVCRTECAFFRMCRKKQKLQTPTANDKPIELVFRAAATEAA